MISFRRSTHPISLLFLFGSLAAFLPSARARPAPWLKIETPDFVVYSDAPAKDAIDCALRYAVYRRAFGDLFVAPHATLPPSVLMLFRSEGAFLANMPPKARTFSFSSEKISNYSVEIDGEPLNAFALGHNLDDALEDTFEFETIWALQRLGYFVPIWMAQGAGEVLSRQTLKQGRWFIGYTYGVAWDDPLPWPEFFALSKSSAEYHDHEVNPKFLNQAWGLMHWVLLKDSAGRERFRSLAERLRTINATDAISAVMNAPPDRFPREISLDFRHPKPREIPFDEAAERALLHPQPAPEAEVLVQTANLLAATGQRTESDAQLDRANRLAPNLPVVKEALARRRLRDGRPQDALRLYREAIAAGTHNAAAYILSAEARLDELRTTGHDVAGEGGPRTLLSIAELRQAIKLNPGSVTAYQVLGRAFYVEPTVTAADLAELSRGIVPTAAGEVVRFYRGALAARLGRTDGFLADLRGVIADPLTTDELRRTAQEQLITTLVRRDATQVEAFLREKNYAAARTVIRQGTASAETAGAAAYYARIGRSIDEGEAWTQLRAYYEAKQWSQFRQASDQFGLKYSSSPHLPALRQLIAGALAGGAIPSNADALSTGVRSIHEPATTNYEEAQLSQPPRPFLREPPFYPSELRKKGSRATRWWTTSSPRPATSPEHRSWRPPIRNSALPPSRQSVGGNFNPAL